MVVSFLNSAGIGQHQARFGHEPKEFEIRQGGRQAEALVFEARDSIRWRVGGVRERQLEYADPARTARATSHSTARGRPHWRVDAG